MRRPTNGLADLLAEELGETIDALLRAHRHGISADWVSEEAPAMGGIGRGQ